MHERTSSSDRTPQTESERYFAWKYFELGKYDGTGKLSIELIMGAQNDIYPTQYNEQILLDRDHINDSIGIFEKTTWFEGGLQDYVTHHRNSAGRKDNIEIRTASSAGRSLITVLDSDRNIDITVITASDEPQDPNGKRRMGLQSIHATAKQAAYLLATARQLYTTEQLVLERDPNITIA